MGQNETVEDLEPKGCDVCKEKCSKLMANASCFIVHLPSFLRASQSAFYRQSSAVGWLCMSTPSSSMFLDRLQTVNILPVEWKPSSPYPH